MKNYTYTQQVGCSSQSLKSLDRHVAKIGDVVMVRGYYGGRKLNPWYRLAVRGTRGTLYLTGCSWGYSGQGPRTTADVMVKLGVPRGYAERVAFNTSNEDTNRPMHLSFGKTAFVVTSGTIAALISQANRLTEVIENI
jgi:hypothetical protein